MKLKDIPAPAWYVGGALIAAVVAFYLVKRGAAAAGAALNPVNPNNAAASAVNAVGAAITGDDDWSLGTAIYNATHADEGAAITGPTTAKAETSKTPITNAPNPSRPNRPTS